MGCYAIERRLIAATGYALVQAASDAASKLELMIVERQGDVEVFAASPIARGNDRQALSSYLYQLLKSYRAYQWLGVTDSHGRLIASTDPSTLAQDRSASPWFRQAIKSDGVTILDAKMTEEVHNRLAITFTAPIIALNGDFHGVFAAVVELPYLADLLDRTTRVLQNVAWSEDSNIEYQLLTRNGDLIADSYLRGEGHINLSAMGLPSARLVAIAQQGFVEELHLRRQQPVVTAYAQVNIAQAGSPLRWGILIRVDRNSILKPIRSFLLNLMMISMLVVVPIALLLLWLVRQLYREWLLAIQESIRASRAESALSARVKRLMAWSKRRTVSPPHRTSISSFNRFLRLRARSRKRVTRHWGYSIRRKRTCLGASRSDLMKHMRVPLVPCRLKEEFWAVSCNAKARSESKIWVLTL